MTKKTTVQRLNIIKGQIDGLARLMEEKGDCHKITEQFYAINSGLKKAMEMYFKENLSACLSSINFKKRRTIEFLLKKIIENK